MFLRFGSKWTRDEGGGLIVGSGHNGSLIGTPELDLSDPNERVGVLESGGFSVDREIKIIR